MIWLKHMVTKWAYIQTNRWCIKHTKKHGCWHLLSFISKLKELRQLTWRVDLMLSRGLSLTISFCLRLSNIHIESFLVVTFRDCSTEVDHCFIYTYKFDTFGYVCLSKKYDTCMKIVTHVPKDDKCIFADIFIKCNYLVTHAHHKTPTSLRLQCNTKASTRDL